MGSMVWLTRVAIFDARLLLILLNVWYFQFCLFPSIRGPWFCFKGCIMIKVSVGCVYRFSGSRWWMLGAPDFVVRTKVSLPTCILKIGA